MENNLVAMDCMGKEITVGMTVEGVMSEVAIMGIEGEVEEIKFSKGEAYGKLKGRKGYWHLRQFQIVK